MKKYLISIIILFCVSFVWAGNLQKKVIARKNAGYHPDTAFIWECSSTAIEYADTGGDAVATAIGSEEDIDAVNGWLVFDDATGNGNDYYYTSVGDGAFHEVNDEIGTIFIKFKVDDWEDTARLWNPWADADNTMYVALTTSDDVRGVHEGTTDFEEVILTGGNVPDDGTFIVIRYRWNVNLGANEHEITVCANEACSATTETLAEDNLTAFDALKQLGTDSHYFGQDTGEDGGNFSVDYYHIYKTWRDTDPTPDAD